MKKQILAVCDGEAEYARRFCDYMGKKTDYPLDAAAFTSVDKLKSFCREEEVAVALVAESVYEETLAGLAGQVILLTDEERKGDGVKSICKYQPCEMVMKEVMGYYAESVPSKPFLPGSARQGRIRMIGLYTPVHRCMQTTFAMTLGELLAKEHKVLYLNFESFSGWEKRMDREFMTDMSDLIYYVANAREALFYKLKGMTEKLQNLDYIPPAFSYMDLARITPQQWFTMFEELEKHTEYDYLILDLSDNIQGLFDILRMCEKVFTLVRDDSAAAAKLYQYERLLERADYGDVLEKTRRRRLPFIRNVPVDTERLTYGELADYIRKIIKEEFYEE